MTDLSAPSRVRGQPLLVLAIILGSWMGMRLLLWQSPFASEGLAPVNLVASEAVRFPVRSRDRSLKRERDRLPIAPRATGPTSARSLSARWVSAADESESGYSVAPASLPAGSVVDPQRTVTAGFATAALSAPLGHDVAPSRGAQARARAGQEPLLAAVAPHPGEASRWSGDGWVYARQDRSGPLAAGQPFYGRSQAGAVLRYRLAPSSGHRPVGYVRATRAIAGPAETEVAAGVAARPLPGLPLSVAAEIRVTAEPGGREARPAAFAVTELPPFRLPFGLRGEVYAQAGYVGGRFATPFADGQARLDGSIATLGAGGQVRIGGGIWGGAQKHAARLDIGPGATVDFRVGETRARLVADYRLRIAGDAEPKSGPALTFSAGF